MTFLTQKRGPVGQEVVPEKIPEHKVERSCREWPNTTQPWGSGGLLAASSPSGIPEKAPVWESGGFSVCSNFYCWLLWWPWSQAKQPCTFLFTHKQQVWAMVTIEIQIKNSRTALTTTNTQKQRYSFTATTGKHLKFVFGEAMDSLCEPDPLWTPRSSKGLPPFIQNCLWRGYALLIPAQPPVDP